MAFLRALRYPRFASYRHYTVATSDIRSRLQYEIKNAMKNRDTSTSMTLRSVMAEINSAEKASKDGGISSLAIASIIRKAVHRRNEAAFKFHEASRLDLKEKEQEEAALLSKFLPPLLSVEDIDTHLRAVLGNLPAGSDLRKSFGLIFKDFYTRVDKSTVDPNLVKQRAQELMNRVSQS
ncbi:hypothetical protein GALMADRAFT_249436 [Galerina marginata CBS 339.88]|uniref:Altered inheritance of mitochondria protein 41 n=1 Tax=Galerina marginata (strain CBS 339.88) TaxID=685588 RepID=A0A067SWT0_GALM3|nr:hypothetical protein GALMADRAFT_249436 [Galerina marginata CBS 339.88]